MAKAIAVRDFVSTRVTEFIQVDIIYRLGILKTITAINGLLRARLCINCTISIRSKETIHHNTMGGLMDRQRRSTRPFAPYLREWWIKISEHGRQNSPRPCGLIN